MNKYLIDVITDGVGMGEVLIINDIKTVYCTGFKGVEEEIASIWEAFNKSITQLERLKQSVSYADEAFLDVHIMLLLDEVFKKEIIALISAEMMTAELAFSITVDKYISTFKDAKNTYLKERYVDLADIKQRVLKNINNIVNKKPATDVILVVDELLPSMMMDFKNEIKGVIAKKGGFTTHAVILCRSREIPYIIMESHNFKNHENVIIDTRKKLVIQNPSMEIIREYEYLEMNLEIEKPIINFSGYGLKLLANVSANNEIKKVLAYNFDGVGLYRTEFIFMNSDRPLSFDEQYQIYHEAIMKMKKKPITFRTFDVGDDKKLSYLASYHKGIDNYKRNAILFETQVKALITANSYQNIKICFPMIATYEEFAFLKQWVLNIQEELNDKNIIEIGMMLETKEALEHLETFKSVDFFSLGTNDLTSELYHISRNDALNYQQYIKDLIERLKTVVSFCEQNDITLSICGELAAINKVTKMLLKIGFKNLSVSVSSIKTLELSIKEYFNNEKEYSD